jgi:hypothetical protein
MMKPLTAALLLVSLVLLAHGGEGLYHAATNRQPVAVTCHQLAQQRPRALWLRVSGCNIDYLGAGYRESNGRLDELFFPMRPPSQPPTAPIALVVATADPQVLAVAGKTIGNNQQPDQETYLVMMLRIVTMLRASKEVDGYARSGFIERLQTRRALAGLTAPLAPDFVALDLRAKPSFVIPGVTAGIGLALLLAALALRRGRPRAAVVDEPIAADSSPADAFAAPMSRRLPAVMLLNLEPPAAAADLENAPPLGSHEEVIERIAGVLGPLSGADDRRITVQRPGWSLAFDLGGDDRVWTLVVETRGSDESIAALEKLARKTGWQIFVPRLGTFVEPAALGTLDKPRNAAPAPPHSRLF